MNINEWCATTLCMAHANIEMLYCKWNMNVHTNACWLPHIIKFFSWFRIQHVNKYNMFACLCYTCVQYVYNMDLLAVGTWCHLKLHFSWWAHKLTCMSWSRIELTKTRQNPLPMNKEWSWQGIEVRAVQYNVECCAEMQKGLRNVLDEAVRLSSQWVTTWGHKELRMFIAVILLHFLPNLK